MKSSLLLPAINEAERTEKARRFCAEFLGSRKRKKYIMGRNNYAKSVLDAKVTVDGIIDDFTEEKFFMGYPIVRTEDVPENSLVLVSCGAQTKAAIDRVEKAGLDGMDFYTFRYFSRVLVTPVYDPDISADFFENEEKYLNLFKRLDDDESKDILRKLVSFRVLGNYRVLDEFVYNEEGQYFEDFVGLREDGESFIDAGGYDGKSTLRFIKRCPGFQRVDVFEPEPENFAVCQEWLAFSDKIRCHNIGLSDRKGILNFTKANAASRFDTSGTLLVSVDRLDNVVTEPFSFLKMDIEGAELTAIEGARQSITAYHPRLALCVYHCPGDFWRIPEKILSIREDYRIRLRHYTRTMEESVMYFLPD